MAMVTEFSSQPDNVLYCALPDGQADVWLRKNIRAVTDDEGNERWLADEVYARTHLSRAEVEAQFEALFAYEAPKTVSMEDVMAILVDQEYRLCLVEMGV